MINMTDKEVDFTINFGNSGVKLDITVTDSKINKEKIKQFFYHVLIAYYTILAREEVEND